AKQSTKVTFSVSMLGVGDWPIVVTVNADNSVPDKDKTNNSLSGFIRVIELPKDLLITEAYTVPAQPQVGQSVNAYVTVKQVGPGSTPACKVGLSRNNLILKQDLSGLAFGQSATVVFDLGVCQSAGTFTWQAWADVESTVLERDEANNTAQVTFTVIQLMLPDMVITSLAPYDAYRSSIRYRYTVKNSGTASVALSQIVIQAYVSKDTVYRNLDDRPAGGTILAASGTLAPGQSYSGQFGCAFSTPVDYSCYRYLVARIDSNNQVAELAETNNDKSATIPYTLLPVGWKEIFYANFDNNTLNGMVSGGSGNWVVRPDSSLYGNQPRSLSYAAYLGDSTSGGFSTPTLDVALNLSSYQQVKLDFDWVAWSLFSPEYFQVKIWDGSWKTLASYVGTSWQHKTIDLSSYNKIAGFIIRFEGYMDYPESSDAAYLDNLAITAQ
ncbi:MAG: CARDB domain-containing protein, partial [Candidatus Komeilibacteria bacterium]|nr:CARDB domain-containing protein [Candidatus Komeilibacteria bacterium]